MLQRRAAVFSPCNRHRLDPRIIVNQPDIGIAGVSARSDFDPVFTERECRTVQSRSFGKQQFDFGEAISEWWSRR